MASANEENVAVKAENSENGNPTPQQGGGHGGGQHFAGRGRGGRFVGNRRPPMQQNNVSFLENFNCCYYYFMLN